MLHSTQTWKIIWKNHKLEHLNDKYPQLFIYRPKKSWYDQNTNFDLTIKSVNYFELMKCIWTDIISEKTFLRIVETQNGYSENFALTFGQCICDEVKAIKQVPKPTPVSTWILNPTKSCNQLVFLATRLVLFVSNLRPSR